MTGEPLILIDIAKLPFVYRWTNEGRHNQPCRVLARGTLNSCLVQFADGHTMVTSRNSLRRRKTGETFSSA